MIIKFGIDFTDVFILQSKYFELNNDSSMFSSQLEGGLNSILVLKTEYY